LEKQLQKEQQKLERKRQKEEREAEKQRLKQIQEVNKIKYDKLELCRELILDISNNLSEKTLVDYLRDNPKYNSLTINIIQHDIHNIIKWKRKVTAAWDDELCAFMPISERIQDESFLLIYFDITEFIKLIKDDNLSDNINRFQRTFSEKKLIVLIEGYENYCRKRKTQINRNFTNAVRLGIEEYDVEDTRTTTASTKKKKKNHEQEPDLEEMEEKLLWLQVIAKCLIIHTKDIEDTAEMIGILSTDIATIPYKNRNCDLNFWAEGQVRVGTNFNDTWLRMLQEIQFVTEPVARGIISVYPTVKSLYNAYNKCITREEAESLLTYVEISSIGSAQRRCINKPLSKRIYEIFMGTNPDYIIS
jgi:crossover junction endonuclease EME1